MTQKLRRVVVRQGDCVSSIAAAHGIGDTRMITDHPDNQPIFGSQNRGPDILRPGDVLSVPTRQNEHTASQDQKHEIRVQMPRTKLRLVLRGADLAPLANERVLVQLPGSEEKKEASTDGDGLLETDIPPRARQVRVELPERKEVLIVRLGQMDPIEDDAGVQKRLANLGYLPPSAQASEDEQRLAVTRFRADRGLGEGEVDDDLRSALRDAHGS